MQTHALEGDTLALYTVDREPCTQVFEHRWRQDSLLNLTRMIICYKYPGSMIFFAHLNHISHCKIAFGTNRSKRWSYRVFIISTRRDEIGSVVEGIRISWSFRSRARREHIQLSPEKCQSQGQIMAF